MKLKQLFILLILNVSISKGQNFTVANSQPPTCFGVCDGFVTYTTSNITGPFTAIVTSTGSCANSTVQSSTGNTITISNICACADIYTVTIKNASLVVVGSELIQFPVYATASLIVNTASVSVATCSDCCDGKTTITHTGGNPSTVPTFSIDGVLKTNVAPATSLCPGSHTVCAKDLSNCTSCTVFNVSFTTAIGIQENTNYSPISLSPNPAITELMIESTQNNSISKVEVFNITGQKVIESVLPFKSETRVLLDVSGLNEGLYYVKAFNSLGQIMQHKKFIKAGL
jgi:hypothetical protein